MQISGTDKFKKSYKKLPEEIKKAAQKQFLLLLSNPNHPSLNRKKMKGLPGIWEARITHGYRFTFQVEGDLYILRNIGAHDILENP